MLLVIPAKYRKNGQGKTLLIEMKKEKGGRVSKEQKEWLKALDSSEGVSSTVCRGEVEAIDYIKGFMQLTPPQLSDNEVEDIIHNL